MKTQLVDQLGAEPTRKVAFMTAAGAVFSLAVWIMNDFYGITMPAEVQAITQAAIMAVTGYQIRDRSNT